MSKCVCCCVLFSSLSSVCYMCRVRRWLRRHATCNAGRVSSDVAASPLVCLHPLWLVSVFLSFILKRSCLSEAGASVPCRPPSVCSPVPSPLRPGPRRWYSPFSQTGVPSFASGVCRLHPSTSPSVVTIASIVSVAHRLHAGAGLRSSAMCRGGVRTKARQSHFDETPSVVGGTRRVGPRCSACLHSCPPVRPSVDTFVRVSTLPCPLCCPLVCVSLAVSVSMSVLSSLSVSVIRCELLPPGPAAATLCAGLFSSCSFRCYSFLWPSLACAVCLSSFVLAPCSSLCFLCLLPRVVPDFAHH